MFAAQLLDYSTDSIFKVYRDIPRDPKILQNMSPFHIYLSIYHIYIYIYIHIYQYVPHKAVAEVSKIGNPIGRWLLWMMDGRANEPMDRQAAGGSAVEL